MTGNSQSCNMASSPTSADSYTYGTPSTVPTVVSPEHNSNYKGKNPIRDTEKLTQSVPDQNHAFERANRITIPAPIRIPSGSNQQQLSPNAEVFTPSASLNAGLFPSTPAAGNNVSNGAVSQPLDIAELSPVSQLVAQSSPDIVPSTIQNLTQGVQGYTGVIGESSQTVTLSGQTSLDITHVTPNTIIHEGRFSFSENFGRAFLVIGVNTSPGQLAAAFPPDRFPTLTHIDTRNLARGTFSAEFSDLRDAKQGWALMAHAAPHATILKLNPGAVPGRSPSNDLFRPANAWEGEYVVSFTPITGQQQLPIPMQELAILLTYFGDLLAVHTVRPRGAATIALHIEYHDVGDGLSAFQSLNGARISQGYRLTVERYVRNYPVSGLPPIPQNTQPISQAFPNFPPHRPPNGNNHVDVNRILAGNDVRTTIMLRNIPNRITQNALKALLDQTSLGDYDFMYLRIDFANNCNVGYAFINFVDPMAIVPFARARAGQRWNVFHSDKIAEISYATIQGRDCLIQKFRNSSVMLEKGAFRPKLFITGSGPNAGQEEPFPEPDNLSKLRRSCENAAHIGLYIPPAVHMTPPQTPSHYAPVNQVPGGVYTAPSRARQAVAVTASFNPPQYIPPPAYPYNPSLYAPREGQAYRERQRRQHSSYDRGTPGAEYEARAMSLIDTPPSSASRGFSNSHESSPFDLSSMSSALGDVFISERGTAEAHHDNGSFVNGRTAHHHVHAFSTPNPHHVAEPSSSSSAPTGKAGPVGQASSSYRGSDYHRRTLQHCRY